MSQSEGVLCLPTETVWTPGELTRNIGNGAEFFASMDGKERFISREQCETDESWQQIITYVIIRRVHRVLLYDRGSKGGESRLSGKLSTGIGGHVNRGDAVGTWSMRDTFYRGCMREVNEETTKNAPVFVGDIHLIREIDSAVGRVHTGVVLVAGDEWPEDPCNHADSDDAWVYPSMIIDHPRLETWSKMALGLIFNL